MSCELITGHAGKPHIDADDVASLLKAAIASADRVIGTMPTAAIQDANTVRVGAFDMLLQGRHVRCASYTDLTIDSGRAGYNRLDSVVCRYTRDAASGVESAALAVVKGTATTDRAKPPALKSGTVGIDSTVEVELFRVEVNGITPQPPTAIIASVPSLLDTSCEYGTSGIWRYLKFANGTAFCMGRYSSSINIGTKLDAYHYYSASVAVSLPFAFAETPSFMGQAGALSYVAHDTGVTGTDRVGFYVVRPSSGAVNYVDLFVWGRWK